MCPFSVFVFRLMLLFTVLMVVLFFFTNEEKMPKRSKASSSLQALEVTPITTKQRWVQMFSTSWWWSGPLPYWTSLTIHLRAPPSIRSLPIKIRSTCSLGSATRTSCPGVLRHVTVSGYWLTNGISQYLGIQRREGAYLALESFMALPLEEIKVHLERKFTSSLLQV